MKTMIVIMLLFNGEVEFKKYKYKPQDYDGIKGITNEEIIISCSDFADKKREEISEFTWEYKNRGPLSHGWYLKNGKGTWQGYIC